MNVQIVRLNRKYNLGNYETLDVGLEAGLTELEGADANGVLKVLGDLERLAELYLQNRLVRTPGEIEKKKSAAVSTPSPTASVPAIDKVRKAFPEELEDRLTFTVKGDWVIVKAKEFLGHDTFGKVAGLIRGLGGEYISAGKDSHFRVPV